MTGPATAWDPAMVRNWLQSRLDTARLDQAAADRRGYEARDDYDLAAGEEWVCRTLQKAPAIDDRTAFAAYLKELLARDDYPLTGIHDERRVDRHVRAHLRKIAKMTKDGAGFANTRRYQ